MELIHIATIVIFLVFAAFVTLAFALASTASRTSRWEEEWEDEHLKDALKTQRENLTNKS